MRYARYLSCLWLLLYSIPAALALCENLPDEPTWDDFVATVQTAPLGFARICPFVISKRGCPTSRQTLFIQQTTDIICDRPSGGTNTECVLDCPNVQVSVRPGVRLQMENIIVQNTVDVPVLHLAVNAHARLQSVVFANHTGDGAIQTDLLSTLTLIDCEFRNNVGVNGGAISAEGLLRMEGTRFWRNVALHSGGAVWMGSTSILQIQVECAFGGNVAADQAPVILSIATNAGQIVVDAATSSCDNTLLTENNGVPTCNGVQRVDTSCTEFSKTCRVPTPSPTLPPTTPNPTPVALPPTIFELFPPSLFAPTENP